IRLDRAQYERLKELAHTRGQSVAEVVRHMVERALGPPRPFERRRVARRLKDFLYSAAPESLRLRYRVIVEQDGVGVFEAELPSVPGLSLPPADERRA
ncbi:MAG: CopG family transcriptional regulator, partial [Gemmatimonadales bacterium]